MKREERFVGNGNIWIANSRYRGWQLTCASCGISKTITSHDGSSIPPHVIIQRFERAGWDVGTRSINDTCPGCQRRRRPSPIVNGHATPMPAPPQPIALPVASNWCDLEEYLQQLRVLSNHTLSALKASKHNTAGALIEEMVLRLKSETTSAVIASTKPASPIKPPPSPPPAPVEDIDYDKWLSSLEGPQS